MSNLVVDTINSRSGLAPIEVLGAGISYNGQTFSSLDVVNVKTVGAKGDGITDDTAAIQSAIDTGKTVFIPKSSAFYKLTSVLQINTAYQKIFSDCQAQLRQTTTNANVIQINSVSGVSIEGLTLRAAGTRTTYETGAAVLALACYRVRVKNCLIENHLGAGIALMGGSGSTIESNHFLSSPAIDTHTDAQALADILIVNSVRNIVSENTMLSGQAFGVLIEANQTNHNCDGNVIADNIIRGVKGCGINVNRSETVAPLTQSIRGTIITGNVIDSIRGTIRSAITNTYVYGQGIRITGSEHAVVSNNAIYATHTFSGTYTIVESGAIDVKGTTNISISGNTITSSLHRGISLEDTSNLGKLAGGALVSNNSIYEASSYGVYSRNILSVSIKDNEIIRCSNGIFVHGSSGLDKPAHITNNKIQRALGVNGHGIMMTFASESVVVGNSIHDPNVVGMTIFDSSNILINNNQVLGVIGVGATGINIANSCINVTLVGNLVNGNGVPGSIGFNLGVACTGAGNLAVNCTTPRNGIATIASTI